MEPVDGARGRCQAADCGECRRLIPSCGAMIYYQLVSFCIGIVQRPNDLIPTFSMQTTSRPSGIMQISVLTMMDMQMRPIDPYIHHEANYKLPTSLAIDYY